MPKHTISSSVIVLSFLLAMFNNAPANAGTNRASSLRLSSGTSGAPGAKNVARSQTPSPFAVQKITQTLKSAPTGDDTTVSGNANSTQRPPSVKYPVASSTSQASVNNRIHELEDRIEQLQNELEQKITYTLAQMYSDIEDVTDNLQKQIDTTNNTIEDKKLVTQESLDEILTADTIKSKLGDTYLKQADKADIMSAVDIKIEDKKFLTETAVADVVEAKLTTKEFLTADTLTADTIKGKLGNEYLTRAERQTILDDANSAAETKIEQQKEFQSAELAKAKDEINKKIVAVETGQSDPEELFKPFDEKIDDIRNNYVRLDDFETKLDSTLTVGAIKNKLDNTYLKKTETENIMTAVDNKIDNRKFLTEAAVADVVETKLTDKGVLTGADRLQILDSADKATQDKLKDYVTSSTLDNTVETKLDSKNFLTDASLTTDTLKRKLDNEYLAKNEKENILSTVNTNIDSKIDDRNFLTQAEFTSQAIETKLGSTYLKAADKGEIISQINNDIAGMKFLTEDSFTGEAIKGKLGDAYLTKDDEERILTAANNAADAKIDSRGFLTEESQLVQTISQNINNINTNLGKTVTALNTLDDRISDSEKSLQALDIDVATESKKIDTSTAFQPVTPITIKTPVGDMPLERQP